MSDVTIYHNPKCGTSRNTLAMIRNAGIEPQVVLYLETPPSRAELKALFSAPASACATRCVKGHALCRAGPGQSGAGRRGPAGRHRGASHPAEPPLRQHAAGRAAVPPVRASAGHPAGAAAGAFTKEDGEAVIDAQGKRIQK